MSTSRGKDFSIHPNQLGGFEAAKELCRILNNSLDERSIPIKEKHRLISFYNHIQFEFDQIKLISYYGLREQLYVLWRNHRLTYIDGQNWSPDVKTYMKNIINSCGRLKFRKTKLLNV